MWMACSQRSMLAAMTASCSVKAQERYRLPPWELVAICDQFWTITPLTWLCAELIESCDKFGELTLSPSLC